MKKINLPSPLLQSRIKTEDIRKSEQWLGYFLGPCLVHMIYTGIAGTYLMQFYTDVLGLAGVILTMMPLIAKVLSGVIGFFIGRIIDKTRTVQGKARPWILLSGPMLAICGFLLYAVPHASYALQIVWVVVSYNLFFSLAFSVYSLSHAMMVPLSTRNTKQRDSLSMMTSMGTSMIPGMLSTVLMPLLVRRIGVGSGAYERWLTVMSILSIIAIPATLLEYYFTRERVTEELESKAKCGVQIAFKDQIRACLHNHWWMRIILFTACIHLSTSVSHGSMLYYSNWVLANSVDSGASKQILVNMIGQAPLGCGIALLWPLVRKYGKRPVALVGFTIAAAGSLLVFFGGNDMKLVLIGLLIRSTGSLPSYTMMALLAEALDSIEKTQGFRPDGFSASFCSIVHTVMMGLGQTILLAGINLFGYIVPQSTAQIIAQPEAVTMFFRWCFAGLPTLLYSICAMIMLTHSENAVHPGKWNPLNHNCTP